MQSLEEAILIAALDGDHKRLVELLAQATEGERERLAAACGGIVELCDV